MPFVELEKLLTEFCCGAVRTQELLNRDYPDRRRIWEDAMASVPPEVLPVMGATAPKPQIARSYEIAASAAVAITRDIGFTVRALPLNLSYSIQHRVRKENCSRIQISVEQIPLAPKS